MVLLKSNLVLIGMPGAGKSTIGVLLAKYSQRNFADTDLIIQSRQGCTLQQIVDSRGHEELRRIEAEVLCSLDLQSHVIATGGSAVYSTAAMRHLQRDGFIIFLEVSLPVLKLRLGNFGTRGIARQPDQSLEDLFAERDRLYRAYADLIIPCDPLTPEQVCESILNQIS